MTAKKYSFLSIILAVLVLAELGLGIEGEAFGFGVRADLWWTTPNGQCLIHARAWSPTEIVRNEDTMIDVLPGLLEPADFVIHFGNNPDKAMDYVRLGANWRCSPHGPIRLRR